MKLAFLAACAAVALSGCNTLGGLTAPNAGGGSALLDTVKTIAANCTGAFNANLIFAPPLPPSGSLVVAQTCGGAVAKPVPAPTQ